MKFLNYWFPIASFVHTGSNRKTKISAREGGWLATQYGSKVLGFTMRDTNTQKISFGEVYFQTGSQVIAF